MSIPFRRRTARDEDVAGCQAFIRGTHHHAAAFVCIGDSGTIEASGAHNMSALQLLAVAHALLTSAAKNARVCPCDACRVKEAMARDAIAALGKVDTAGRAH